MKKWLLTIIVAGIPGTTKAQEPLTLPKHAGWVGAVALSPDSRTLAVGTSDGGVALWDANTGKMITPLKVHKDAVAALAWRSDGKQLASGGHDRLVLVHDTDGDRDKHAHAH